MAQFKGQLAVMALVELGIDVGYLPNTEALPIGADSRADAIKLGVRKYFTGKPCKHGHLAPRLIGGGCVDCRKIDRRRYSKGKQKTKTLQKKRARERRRAALAALNELGIEI